MGLGGDRSGCAFLCFACCMRRRIQGAVLTVDRLSGRIEHDPDRRRGRAELPGRQLGYCAAGLGDGQGYEIELREKESVVATLTYHRTEGEPYLHLGGKRTAIMVRENTIFDGEAVLGEVWIRGDDVEVELRSDDVAVAFIFALNAMYALLRGLFRP